MYREVKHSYSYLANQELLWCPRDSEDVYNKHLDLRKSDLEKYNWINKNFTYKFNSKGFRSDEFSQDDNMLTLGCSHAMGIGLPVENTWAHIVSSRLGLKNFNLGLGGGSNDSSFRMAHNWIHQLKPKIVVLMVTHAVRMEVVSEDEIHQYYVADSHINSGDDLLWNYWITNDTNSTMNAIKNTMAIQHMCDVQKIKLVITNHMCSREVDFARDLMHAGVKTNEIIADNVCNIIDGSADSFGSCLHYNSIHPDDKL